MGPEWQRDLEGWVRQVVRWHLDPATGSPYWIARSRTLGFDPLREVRGVRDLLRFPPLADEWRLVPARDLIPRGALRDGPFAVWETGGTTGPPRRIVDGRVRFEGLRRIAGRLHGHGFPGPGAGDWLHLGPTGPHLVGRNVGRLAAERGELCHYVDLDPRWVKRLYREGRAEEARRYVRHVLDQALAILATQPVRLLATTPPLLLELVRDPVGLRLVREKVRGVIWFGTSLSEESLRTLREEVLPEAVLVGWYGNTLMGIACQRPSRPGDRYQAIFQPPFPEALVQVVDPADPSRQVPYGESGRVMVSLLNRELFLPYHLERDEAIRVPPELPDHPWDGLACIRPVAEGAEEPGALEGVY